MKKITCLIFMVILLLSSLFIFTGCDIYVGQMHIHIHEFKQHADDAYLKSKATCYLPTEYYYSCYCGQKSADTFITQQTLGHDMSGGRAVCYRCNYVDFTRAYTVENGVITGLTDSAKQLSYLEIPQVIDGVAIAGIADSAFENNSSVMRVTIPDFIIKVGKNMFRGCNFLQSVEVQCAQVSENMFYGCGSLKNVYLGKNVTTIGNGAFYGCSSLSYLSYEENITTIGNSAFYRCSALEDLIYSIVNLTQIGDDAFRESGLKKIYTQAKLTSIGKNAFRDCSQLSYFSSTSDNLTIGENAFYNCTSLVDFAVSASNFSFKEGNVTINENAFYNCTNLYNVFFAYKTVTLAENVFTNCKSISSIGVPYDVLHFFDKTNLTDVTITTGTTIEENAFKDCTKLYRINLPDTLLSIEQYAFYGCSALSKITFPDSLESIGDHAFSECKMFSQVKLSDNITTIGNYAFNNCVNLITIDLPKNLLTIGDLAFSGCKNLISVSLPSTLETIGIYAFASCKSIKTITIPSSVTSIGAHVFDCCYLSNVYFEDPTGWYHTYTIDAWKNKTGGTEIDLSDPQKNASGFMGSSNKFYFLYK